jgi:hypothetical protein
MGWILTMFDLPVMTDKERKAATKFRNDLLDNGYLMIQFSVYARPCVSYEQMDTHRRSSVAGLTPIASAASMRFRPSFGDWMPSLFLSVVITPYDYNSQRKVNWWFYR